MFPSMCGTDPAYVWVKISWRDWAAKKKNELINQEQGVNLLCVFHGETESRPKLWAVEVCLILNLKGSLCQGNIVWERSSLYG